MKAQRKTSTTKNNKFKFNILAGSLLAVVSVAALASSHREAPSITTTPKADGTDFYMFRSYETNRSDFITLIANYQPLQDGYGGPNYFSMDPNALYEIHIDNDGDDFDELSHGLNPTVITLENGRPKVVLSGAQPIAARNLRTIQWPSNNAF